MRSLERGWVAGWGLRDGGEGTILIKQALLSFSDGTGPVNRKVLAVTQDVREKE